MNLLLEAIRSILETTIILIEGKIEDLEQKYPNINVRELADEDPSNNKKYLNWTVKQVVQGANKEDVIPTVVFFHRNINKFKEKDIYKYSAKELEDKIKDISSSKTNNQQRKEDKEGAEKIYEDENVVLVRVDNKRSCMAYGKGTRWCITMGDQTYYEQYVSSNVIFHFIINKKELNPQYAKIAISTQRDLDNEVLKVELYDANDVPHSPEEIEEYAPSNLVQMAVSDAEKQPKGLLARLMLQRQRDAKGHQAPEGEGYTKEELANYWNDLNKIEDQDERITAKERVADLVPGIELKEIITELDYEDSIHLNMKDLEDFPGVENIRNISNSILFDIDTEKFIKYYGGHFAEYIYDTIIGKKDLDYYVSNVDSSILMDISPVALEKMKKIYIEEEGEEPNDQDLVSRFKGFLSMLTEDELRRSAESKMYDYLYGWINEYSLKEVDFDGSLTIEIPNSEIFPYEGTINLDDFIVNLPEISLDGDYDSEFIRTQSEELIDEID